MAAIMGKTTQETESTATVQPPTSDTAPVDDAATTEDGTTTGDVTPESIVEALLFSTNEPLSGGRLATLIGIGDAGDVKRHVAALNERFEEQGASYRIDAIARGYQMQTLPTYHPWVSKLHKTQADSRLSSAALETLAIVAYKQPVLRADVETIRGVAVGDMLVRLRDVNLVRIVGRAEEVGRPLLYGTTTKFLKVFGLRGLDELPKLDPDRPDAVPALKVVNEPVEETPEPETAPEADTAPEVEPASDAPADTDD